jgi:hypothetical protein
VDEIAVRRVICISTDKYYVFMILGGSWESQRTFIFHAECYGETQKRLWLQTSVGRENINESVVDIAKWGNMRIATKWRVERIMKVPVVE